MRLLLLFSALAFSPAAGQTPVSPSVPSDTAIAAPDLAVTHPETIVAPASALLEQARRWGRASALGDLAALDVAAGDVELRYWGGFGVTGTGGVVLRRQNGEWKGWRVAIGDDGAVALAPLKAWLIALAWEEVIDAGAPILPPTIRRDWTIENGYTHVIELRMGKAYRASVIECAFRPETPDDFRVQKVAGVLARLFPEVPIGCVR